MDGHSFDVLTRQFAANVSRRSVLRTLGAGVLGALAGSPGLDKASAASCRAADRTCSKDIHCCSTICGPKNRTNRRVCVCPEGQEACRGACKSPADYQSDPANCGACQNRCKRPAHAIATCADGLCDLVCNPGYHRCGDACVRDTDPAHCGTSCNPCVPPANATATCAGVACGFTCTTGFHECGGACVSNTDPATCGTSCVPCPTPANATATCNGTTCGFTCDSGFNSCGAGCCPTGQTCCNGVCCDAGQSCIGNQCQSACLPLQALCDPFDNACCPDGGAYCSFGANCTTEQGEARCCRDNSAACSGYCDCCDNYDCQGGVCCGAAGGAQCSESSECCAGVICQFNICCKPEGTACSSTDECCEPMTCRGGSCQFSCPLGGFPCGSACCRGDQICHEATSTCEGCLPLQSACDPNNNLCCWDETTLCPSTNPYGNANTCCRPQGGHCSSAADCCAEVYDLQWDRDTCGDDGRCGGKGAYCGTDADCVDGRECWGACFGPGAGFQLCHEATGECPAGQLCSQRRCAYRTELPN